MNLKQLEAFVKVAETKSFSETAKQLFLTQPTVSVHISSLEQELNTCLLVRNTRGVALSEEGKELYAYAVQMLELERKIKERFGQKKKDGNVLRIAASTVPSQYILPKIMAKFREEYPKERLKIFETDSEGVTEMILSHHADLGFNGTVLEKSKCTYLPFYEDELVVLTPADEKFRQRKEEGLPVTEWLLEEPVILREDGSGTRKEAEKMLAKLKIKMRDLQVAAVMENQETIKRSVSSGVGVTIISKLAAEEELAAGRTLAFSLGENGWKRTLNMVYDPDYPGLPAAEKFIKTVNEVYKIDKVE